MDNVQTLLHRLRQRGVILQAAGDRLRFAPKHAVSAEERELLKRHKETLLAILTPTSVAVLGAVVGELRHSSSPGPRRGYAGPWPDELPGLGRRTVDFLDACLDCAGERWSWVRYGDFVLCLECATARAHHFEAGPGIERVDGTL